MTRRSLFALSLAPFLGRLFPKKRSAVVVFWQAQTFDLELLASKHEAARRVVAAWNRGAKYYPQPGYPTIEYALENASKLTGLSIEELKKL